MRDFVNPRYATAKHIQQARPPRIGLDKTAELALSIAHCEHAGRWAVLAMDWSYYLVGVVIVLLLLAYRLHGGLFRKDTLRDQKLNRLIDERVERMNLTRDKKPD